MSKENTKKDVDLNNSLKQQPDDWKIHIIKYDYYYELLYYYEHNQKN